MGEKIERKAQINPGASVAFRIGLISGEARIILIIALSVARSIPDYSQLL